MFGRGKDRVDGTARLVSYTETRDRDEFEAIIQAKLVVQAEGLPATEVESYVAVPLTKLPADSGTVWKVRVDRGKPWNLRLLDD